MKASEVAYALRTWTLNSISLSRPKLQDQQLEAAELLSKIVGQKFPSVAYRALFVNTTKLRSWKDFRQFIKNRGLPESYSLTSKGVQKFLADGGGAGNTKGLATLVLEVDVSRADWMFNLTQLIRKLPLKVQQDRTAERADFPLSMYLKHEEVVARAGTLLRAVHDNRVRLIGYQEGRKLTMLPRAKLLGASVFKP